MKPPMTTPFETEDQRDMKIYVHATRPIRAALPFPPSHQMASLEKKMQIAVLIRRTKSYRSRSGFCSSFVTDNVVRPYASIQTPTTDSTTSLLWTLQPIVDNGIRKTVDLLLDELEAGKENGINETRSRHRNAKPSIHMRLIELDARHFDRLAFSLG